MREEALKIRKGQAIIEEAERLLAGLTVHPNSGAYVEGSRVAVLVDPRWDEGAATFSMLITCRAFAHQRVDWRGSPVFFSQLSAPDGAYLLFLNDHGQVIAHNLQPGEYRMGEAPVPAPFDYIERGIAPGAHEMRGEMVGLGARYRGEEPDVHVRPSADERITVVLNRTSKGHTRVSFFSTHKDLANAAIHFTLRVTASGKVKWDGDVKLEDLRGPSQDREIEFMNLLELPELPAAGPLWGGTAVRRVDCAESCDLTYWIVQEQQ